MPAAQHDWSAIEQYYVEGELEGETGRKWPEPARVAELFEVPERYVRERARQADWDSHRAAFKAHHEKVLAQKRSVDLVKEATDFDARALSAAKAGLQLVTMRSGELLRAAAERQKAKAEAAAKDEEFEDYGVSTVDAKELQALAGAAESWQRVGFKALGEVETIRTELTGPGGSPIQMQSSVRAQLVRDDPERVMGVVVALERAGLIGLPAAGGGGLGGVAVGLEDVDDDASPGQETP